VRDRQNESRQSGVFQPLTRRAEKGNAMKIRITLCLVLLLSGLLLAWEPPNDTSADASKLIALENAWNQAQLHHDSKALNGLVSDGFVYTRLRRHGHEQGTVSR